MNHAFTRRNACALITVAAPAVTLAVAARAASADALAAMLKTEAAYLDAYNRHDAQAVVACYHADGARWSPSTPVELRGDAILADARALFGIYADFAVQDVKVDAIDDARLVKTFVFRGAWTGRFPPGPFAEKAPTGRSFTMPAVELLAFRDGRIASSRVYFDRLSLLTQIGALGA